MTSSIQNRLTIGLIATLSLLLIGQWLLVSIAIRFTIESYVETHLEHDMESLLGALTFDKKQAPQLTAPRINSIYQLPLSGHYYQMQSNGSILRSRSLWDASLPMDPVGIGGQHTAYHKGPQQQSLIMLTRGYNKSGHDVILQVAEDLTLANRDIRRFQIYHALLSLIAIALLLLLQRKVVRDALRPLDSVREEITQLERGKASTLSTLAPREILPLVEEINRLLAILAKRLERSRKAAGNLAHALKTPLTRLAQQANEPTLKHDLATVEVIRTQTQAIRQLIDREMNRARLAGGEPGHRTEIEEAVTPLIDTLQRIYNSKSLQIETDIPKQAISNIERLDMLELLGNLLDNACKFATHKIRLHYDNQAGDYWIIEDDGPGCTPEQMELLMNRGTRFDEVQQGHGLGMAIAQDIVKDYDGKIVLSASPILGGLRVTINL